MAPHHSECDMLQRAQNWTDKIPREFNTVTIEKEGSPRKLNCYAETFDSGWCGTCHISAGPGEPGYCGPDAEEDKEEDARNKTKGRFQLI